MPVRWNTPRVVVTGATGWLGRRLVDTLLYGLPDGEHLPEAPTDLEIRCFVLPGENPTPLSALSNRIQIVEGDVRDRAACRALFERCEGALVFHCAAVIHPRRARDFFDVNYRGTENLLAAAVEAGVRRAVIVSSNSPLGTNPTRDHLFDESSPYHPYMGYGRSKMMMERHVAEVQQEGQIETVVVRAPWFYGPHQPPRQTLFFTMIRDGKVPVVGDGNNRRSMVYVDNLCQGLQLAALRSEANGGVFWIADERPYTMNEVVDTIERLLEQEFGQRCAHKRRRLPNVASGLARAADWMLQALGLYHQKIHVLSEMNKDIACSVDKAKSELGYRPSVALEEGMRRSIRWCIEQGHLAPSEAAPSQPGGNPIPGAEPPEGSFAQAHDSRPSVEP